MCWFGERSVFVRRQSYRGINPAEQSVPIKPDELEEFYRVVEAKGRSDARISCCSVGVNFSATMRFAS